MTRSFRFATAPLVVLAVLSTCALAAESNRSQQTSDDPLLVGRLATVEPSARRISLIPEGQADRIELVVDEKGEIVRDSQELSLSDLVIQVGSRVKVRYRMENGVRVARTITVEPPPAR